VAIVDTFSITI